jgi:NAD(P)-dependent dehydrogenase (short-subunit alcohol dehydrogenase family)
VLAAQHCHDPGAPRALAVVADVTEPAQMRALADETERHLGEIAVWIKMAGLSM